MLFRRTESNYQWLHSLKCKMLRLLHHCSDASTVSHYLSPRLLILHCDDISDNEAKHFWLMVRERESVCRYYRNARTYWRTISPTRLRMSTNFYGSFRLFPFHPPRSVSVLTRSLIARPVARNRSIVSKIRILERAILSRSTLKISTFKWIDA